MSNNQSSQRDVLVGWIIIIIIFFTGYYYFSSDNTKSSVNQSLESIVNPQETFKNEIQETIKREWSKKLGKECKEVMIVKETEHIYRGFANFIDGTQLKVKVTVDGNQYIYQQELF